MFPGVQKTTWTRDPVAGEYYFHRFYDFQPDLNTGEPGRARRDQADHGLLAAARRLRLPHGRRAVPDREEGRRTSRTKQDFELLHEMRDFLQWRAARRDPAGRGERAARREPAVLRRARRSPADDAELRRQPAAVLRAGDRRHSSRWSRRSRTPTSARPHAQWVQFLRSHDELDLGRLTDEQRAEGVRRRSGPTSACSCTTAASAGASRRCSTTTGAGSSSPSACLFTLPGTPMMQYGDEIGMGDDLRAARARVRPHADAVVVERSTAGSPRRDASCGPVDRRPDLRLPARERRARSGAIRTRCSTGRSG